MAARTCSTVRDSDCVYLHLEKQSQIQNCFRDIQDQRIPKSDYLRECQGQACSKLILSTCLFHSCLPSPEKWKSDANLFKKYSGSKNTQICLAYSMPRAGMLQTNILYIFFFFFFHYLRTKSQTPILSRNIEDQRILKCHRLRGCQPGEGLLQTNPPCLFLSLMAIQMQKIQVRHQSIPEMLRMKKYPNLIGQEHFWP